MIACIFKFYRKYGRNENRKKNYFMAIWIKNKIQRLKNDKKVKKFQKKLAK